jgi:hypothetical protein
MLALVVSIALQISMPKTELGRLVEDVGREEEKGKVVRRVMVVVPVIVIVVIHPK